MRRDLRGGVGAAERLGRNNLSGWTKRRENLNGVYACDFDAFFSRCIAGSNSLCVLSNPGKMFLPKKDPALQRELLKKLEANLDLANL